MNNRYANDVEAVDGLARSYQDLKKEIGKMIIGQDEVEIGRAHV